MTLLLMLLLKSLLVFALSGAALLCLRRASASARYLVCLLTLAALLALPLFSVTLPGWHIAALQEEPAPQQHWLSGGQAATLPKREGAGFRPAEASQFAPPSNNTTSGTSAASSETLRLPASGGQALVPGGFLAFYLLGLLLASARPLLGLWGIARLSRAYTAVDDAATLVSATDCAAALGLRHLPRLCRADVPVPMTWSWIRPVVLLPLGSVGWPEDRLRSVLLHEMAHIKRRDWPCHRLADFACALYWFHPFVWLLARRLRAESEIACDDLVLSSGIAAPDYARHLLDIAGALSRPLPSQSAIAMAQTPHIKRRILMVLDKTHSRRAVTRRVLLATIIPGTAALMTLAILRPDAKAQTDLPAALAVQPAPAAVSSTGVSITLPQQALSLKMDTLTAGTGRPPIASPDMSVNGTTFLVGVGDAVKPTGSWWNARGALLPKPAYAADASSAVQPLPGQEIRQLAFRLPANAQGVTVQYKLPQSTGYSSDGVWPGKSLDQTGQTEAQIFARTSGERIVTAQFPASLSKADIQAGIASGPWRTAASETRTPGALEPFGGTSGSMSGSQIFIMGMPAQTAEGFLLTVSTDTDEDVRVVAVDAQGREVLPSSIGGQSVNKLDQIAAQFSLPLSQVKEFRLETRPFQWVHFKDVALQPVQ